MLSWLKRGENQHFENRNIIPALIRNTTIYKELRLKIYNLLNGLNSKSYPKKQFFILKNLLIGKWKQFVERASKNIDSLIEM